MDDFSGPDPDQPEHDQPEPLPLDGVLDLHIFQPRDVKDLVPDYIDECLKAGILELRIIHGKGIGVLRTIVHDILAKHPAVEHFGLAAGDGGSWGATVVQLRDPRRKDDAT